MVGIKRLHLIFIRIYFLTLDWRSYLRGQTKKTALAGGFSKVRKSWRSCGQLALTERSNQICPSSVAVFGLSLQNSALIHLRSVNLLPVATTSGNSLCLQGLESKLQLLLRRGSPDWTGVRAYSPAWSELPTRNWCQSWNGTNADHNSGMTPWKPKAGTGERDKGATRGKRTGSFYRESCRVSPPLIWASDFVMLVRRRSLWKNGRHAAFPFTSRDRSGFLELYTRMLLPLAPQPNGRSVATEWARKRKENILHWALVLWGPLWRNNRKRTWLNSSRISLCSCWSNELDRYWMTFVAFRWCGASFPLLISGPGRITGW